jgi:hypothetical protein
MLKNVAAFATITAISAGLTQALAQEPCPPDGDFGECKVLIEINASDGDIGFHFLGDGDDLIAMRIDDPNGAKVFENRAFGPLAEQKHTENFGESAEPLCWEDPEGDPEDVEDFVTLREFSEIWTAGTYTFIGKSEGGEKTEGETVLSYDLPAAPKFVDFDGSSITWAPGNDLGHCAPLDDEGYGAEPVAEVLDIIADPASVTVAAYEVVLEPDVEDGDSRGDKVFSVRVPGTTFTVDVPALYLLSLGSDTPVKVEVGAIGVDANATFTEEDGFCVNEVEGCDD